MLPVNCDDPNSTDNGHCSGLQRRQFSATRLDRLGMGEDGLGQMRAVEEIDEEVRFRKLLEDVCADRDSDSEAGRDNGSGDGELEMGKQNGEGIVDMDGDLKRLRQTREQHTTPEELMTGKVDPKQSLMEMKEGNVEDALDDDDSSDDEVYDSDGPADEEVEVPEELRRKILLDMWRSVFSGPQVEDDDMEM